MASCGLCSSFGPTKAAYNYNLASAHVETHFLQMKLIYDGIDKNEIFGRCFPDFAPVNARMGTGRRELLALCHTLFPRKSITPCVVCKKCDEEITICGGRRKQLDCNALIEHACNHLGLKAYECPQCTEEFRSRGALSAHLVTKHQLRSAIGHCQNKVDDFLEDISAMIKACFSGEKKAAHSTGVTIRSAGVSKVRGRTKGSHLAVERQLLCYRLIRKVADRNGYVRCRLCSQRIKATRGKHVQCRRVRDHTYRHLPTPLFRCRLCSDACFGRGDLQLHLQSVHALPIIKQNYEFLPDQYHSELLAILRKCYSNDADSGNEVAFSFRNLSESKISRKSRRSQLEIRRHVLCHQLIRKRANAERLVECRLCSKQINAKMGNTFTSTNVMEHAFSHLGKKFFQCGKCSKSYPNRSGVRNHLKHVHALPMSDMNYQGFADKFHSDIVSTLRQCFGEEDGSEEAQSSVKQELRDFASADHSYLTRERQRLCIQLTRECGDREHKTIQCRLCAQCISVNDGTHAMDHALGHLEKPTHRCKICSDEFPTRSNVSAHIKRKHALRLANNYECLGDQHHAEIVEMLRKCYNNASANEATPFNKSRTSPKAEGNVRGRTRGSKQTVERQLFCYRLIRKTVNSDGKVECRLCNKAIAAKKCGSYFSASAMAHAVVHIKQPIYRCAICSEKRSDLVSIRRHLHKTHALSMANNYECLADKHHSEILAVLRECYGEV